MTPEETLYFANPGKEENFKPEFYFHWEDFNNTIIRDWSELYPICSASPWHIS